MVVVLSFSRRLLALLLLTQLSPNIYATTVVQSCPERQTGRTVDVDLGGCREPPCPFIRNTNTIVQIKFVPVSEVRSLRIGVAAYALLFWVPYVGLDGKSAANNVFTPDGSTRVQFPLKPGVEYLYRNSFHIERYYPSVSPLARWSLTDQNGKNVVCFQVRAKISS